MGWIIMVRYLPVLTALLLFLTGGCDAGRRTQSSDVTRTPAQREDSLGYIKRLQLGYCTSKSLMHFDVTRTEAPFPENTKGVILRISGEDAPADAKISVTWYYLQNGRRLVCTQKVLPGELNRLQYVELSLYHQDAEFPKGDYEVVIQEEERDKSRTLPFSIL